MAVLLRNNEREREKEGGRGSIRETVEQKKTRVGKNSLSKLYLYIYILTIQQQLLCKNFVFLYQTTQTILFSIYSLFCYTINLIARKDKNVLQKMLQF